MVPVITNSNTFEFKGTIALFMVLFIIGLCTTIPEFIESINLSPTNNLSVSMKTPKLTPTQNHSNQDIHIRNIYDELNRTHKLKWYHANGGPRTGSTVLLNILRILIREKIDPNVYNGYTLNLNSHDDEFKDQNYVIINKRHGPCKRIPRGDIFIAHRNVSDQICSAMRMGFCRSSDQGMTKWCVKTWKHYQSCLNHPWLVYDMSYYILIKNMTRIIEDIANALHIAHVMSKYDYEKIENELNHLVPPTQRAHPITQIHPNHIAHNMSCDIEHVVNVIKQDKECNQFYEFVNELLRNNK
eukprot:81975_1